MAFISVFTLLGWAFDIHLLKSPFPRIVAMNPIGAVCLLLLCCCILPFTWKATAVQKAVILCCGFLLPALVSLTGATILVQNILSQGHGLDSILFHREIQALSGTPGSGRMGPFTAFNFMLSGVAITFIASGEQTARQWSNILSLIILLVSVFSLTGYIYRVAEFYGHYPYRPMAVQTSTSFILASLALLLLNARAGFMRIVSDLRAGGFLARLMLPAAILVPVLMGYIRLRLQWAFPVSVELGVNFLICGIVILFMGLILYVAREMNIKDKLRAEAEEKLAFNNEQLEQKVITRTEELYSSEKRFKALIEHSFDVIALYDDRMRLTYLSPSFERLTGFTVQQRMLLNGLSFAHPDDQDASRALIRKVLETPNIPIPFQNRLLHRQGHYIWVEGVLTNLLLDAEVQAIVSNYREITERKAAEENLRVSEIRFRSLIENNFDAIALLDEHAGITYFSASAVRMTGINPEADERMPLFDLIHEDDTVLIHSCVEACLSTPRIPVSFQCRMKQGLDDTLWVEGVMTNLLEDGNIGAIVANFKDVTERRRHEVEMEETNRQMRDILESSIDCFFTCDRNWVVQYWNKAAEQFTGIGRGDIIGKSLWATFPLSPDAVSFRSLHRTMAEGKTMFFEDCHRDLWFGGTAYPTHSGLSVFFRDITERKRIEQVDALEKEVLTFFYTSRKKAPLGDVITLLLNGLRQIHPEMLCSVLRLEQDRLYNWASPHLPEEYSAAIEGMTIGAGEGSCGTAAFFKRNVIVKDIAHDPLWQNYRTLATAHGLSACWSHVIMDDDGMVLGTFAIYYRTVRSPRQAEKLTLGRCHAILKNIIENRLAEERILQLNIELEDRVKQRTRQLEELNKELEAFSYSVSHDLRAPLRSINGYSHILKEECGGLIGADGNRHLDVVITNAKRMGALIDDLLNLSRAGKTLLQKQLVDMNLMVREVIEELQLQWSGVSIAWTITDLEVAQCDRSLMRQVWQNLLSNAIKYSGRSANPAITVGLERNAGVITYFVKDNGAGFDMKYYDKLFGVFQRLHSLSEFPGTGVGLAIVHRIIKRHGGEIWAESEPDRGAVFRFTIPAA